MGFITQQFPFCVRSIVCFGWMILRSLKCQMKGDFFFRCGGEIFIFRLDGKGTSGSSLKAEGKQVNVQEE